MAAPDLAGAIRLHKAGDLAGAEQAYLAILAEAEDADALCNLGLIAKSHGQLVEAERYLIRACRTAPTAAVPAYNLGSLYWRSGRLAEAVAPLELAAALPSMTDARVNLANVYLAQGRDAEGWTLYDERRERLTNQTNRLTFPEWQGEPLAGTRLLIWSEQGLGDQILAARYIAHLQAEAVTLVCPPELARIVEGLGATIVPREGDIAVAGHDYWVLPMSLARWVGPVPNTPYLRGRSGSRPRGCVGLAWKGNDLPDPGRSLPSDLAAELLALPGVISLHPQDTGARDFQDTADIVAGLDLVVSIDTSVAHLAGAMGKATLLLLQYHSVDWRWREKAPWYDCVEVLRQPAHGDWRGLVNTVMGRMRSLPTR